MSLDFGTPSGVYPGGLSPAVGPQCFGREFVKCGRLGKVGGWDMTTLLEQFGSVDIYLFDQLLRGNIGPGMRVVDAGCGGGRNLVYLMREGYEVFGVDASREAVEHVRSVAALLAPRLDSANFRVEAVEAMSFPDGFADVVISSAVLHFARDEAHFQAMFRGTWRVVRPGGLLFCRLASKIGMPVERPFEELGGRVFRMPDGRMWFLVDEPLLMRLTEELGGKLVDPVKTTVVQGGRCMTTWVVRKGGYFGAAVQRDYSYRDRSCRDYSYRGYSYRRATIGSTRVARRAGM